MVPYLRSTILQPSDRVAGEASLVYSRDAVRFGAALVLAAVLGAAFTGCAPRGATPEPATQSRQAPAGQLALPSESSAASGTALGVLATAEVDDTEHEHDHEHDHDHREVSERSTEVGAHHDHNLRAAYLHVLADALTSLFAIVALLGGRLLGYGFLDAVVGIVGALVILRWAWGLTRSSARQLLDAAPSAKLVAGLREHLEQIDDVSVADLHLWEIAPGHRTCIVTIVTSTPRPTEFYRRAVRSRVHVEHLTVEVRRCGCVDDEPAPA